MKTKFLIPLLFLSLILTSCEFHAGDFVNEISIVREINQTQDLKEKRAAKYIIRRYNTQGVEIPSPLILILPENFANVGDHIYVSGTNIYSGPMSAEKK